MSFFLAAILILSFVYPSYIYGEEPELAVHDSKKKLNVVLFFTHVDTKCVALQKDTLGFLNLHEATRIKHSSDEQNSIDVQEQNKTGSSYCKELLKESLMTLTHFCHTVMKMKTAIASVSSKEMTNDIQEPETPFRPPKIDIGREAPHRLKRSDYWNGNKDEHFQKGQYLDSPPHLEKEKTQSNAKNIITGTKHTEVFQIRIKRNAHENEDDAAKKNIKIKIIDDVPSEQHSNDHSWDVLDIVKHVRYSFLGKLFENTLKNEVKADQEDLVDISKLGKEKQDPGLFTMVKSTLDSLQEPPEISFLMVIFGGHLHAVTDKHSPVVQSIKHVVENTDSEHTLIVVTGSCAEDQQEEESKLKPYTMPIYAKGPNSDMLSKCNLLYDIPLTIRKILEVHSGAGLQLPEQISV